MNHISLCYIYEDFTDEGESSPSDSYKENEIKWSLKIEKSLQRNDRCDLSL